MTPINLVPQKSRYTIPVAVAVAAHAFLFFGFAPPKITTPPLIPQQASPPDEHEIPVDLITLDPDPDAHQPAGQREIPAAPSLPEFIPDVIRSSDITVPLVPVRTGPIDPRITVPPSGPPQMGTPEGGSFGPSTLRLVDLDNVPRVTFQARPDYPFTLRSQGVSGEVLVNFLVDEQGRVSDVRIVRSTHPEFEPSTVRAVSRWRFESGKRNGRAVRFRMSQTVSFAIGN